MTIKSTSEDTRWELLSDEERLRNFLKSTTTEDARISVMIAAALRKRVVGIAAVAEVGSDDTDTSEEEEVT